MKNKVELKKCLLRILLVAGCSMVILLLISMYEYHTYTVNFNDKLAQIVYTLNEKYPSLTEDEIMEILNSDGTSDTEFFEKYGIDLEVQSILLRNDEVHLKFVILNMVFFAVIIVLISLIYLRYDRRKDRDIKDITNYIEEINKKNYELQIDSMSEDELSILKTEIYKTTIMLKEAAENSRRDKINLKRSLEDISHQLKTPLTSILIMLDNLLDDDEMPADVRNDFIRDIRREIINVNFLVQSLLKLSKFDADTIQLIRKDVPAKQIVEEAVQKVSTLSDLKNVSISIEEHNENIRIFCDLSWQVEAVTNILKNCIEHSGENSCIIIKINSNKIYNSIIITDNGEGIAPKDLPHIFERFYKGENSNPESVGIGLALAKTIIEQDNGFIRVESEKGKYTKFEIHYYK